jgi:hypothetical protein
VAGTRTKSFRKGSVLTNHNPCCSGNERFDRKYEQVEMGDAGKDEAGPESPDEPEQSESAVANVCCIEPMNGSRQRRTRIFTVRCCDQGKMDVVLRWIEGAREGLDDALRSPATQMWDEQENPRPLW